MLFLGLPQPASIYRNVCVCVLVSADYTAAGGQYICVAVQLVQSKCVCYTCVCTAFYRVAVIDFFEWDFSNLELFFLSVILFHLFVHSSVHPCVKNC